MKNLDNMTDLERIEALKLEVTKNYYQFRHEQLTNEIQKDQIKALENKIKELNHRLIYQEVELAELIKKVI